MRRRILAGLGILLAIMMGGLSFLWTNKSDGLPQSDAGPQVAAVVNGVAVTRAMIDKEIMVSRFNPTNPLPPLTGDDLSRAADEALNQLVTRRLVLQAAGRQSFVVEDTLIEQRVKSFFGDENDPSLTGSLQQAGLTYDDLVWWVGEITTVEEFIVKVIMANAAPTERQQVYNNWLNAQRAAADIML